jgi:hypothetical protein
LDGIHSLFSALTAKILSQHAKDAEEEIDFYKKFYCIDFQYKILSNIFTIF